MKKFISLSIIFLLCLLFIFNSTSLASGSNIQSYFSRTSYKDIDIKSMSANIYSVIKLVGMIIAICMITYMSIEYMLATPQKKAMLKERLVFIIIGVIFLVAGVTFLDWYAEVAKDIANSL